MKAWLFAGATIGALAALPAVAQWVGITGAVPQQSGVNFTNNGTGIVVAGVPWMRFNNQSAGISAVMLGKYAGLNLPDTQGMVAIGELAMASQTDGTGESIVISPWGFPYTTAMHSTVAIGEHVGGVDPAPIACTAVGADVLRDTVGCAGGSVYGSGAVIDGNFVDDTTIGSGNLHGTAANIVVGPGTPNPGDTITVNLTTNDSVNNAGFPVTVTYTVAAGDTTAALLTQNLHAAIDANAGVKALKYTKPAIPGVPTRATAGLVTAAGNSADSLGNQYISFHADGTQTTGMQLVVAASCSGTCPNAVSATGASAPLHNTLVGRGILAGIGMSNPQYNSVTGHGAMPNATSSSFNTINGTFGGQVLATGSNNVLNGYKSGALITTGNNNFCGGYNSCGTTLTTGNNNIILATSAAAAYDVDTPSRSNLISIGGIKRWTNVSLNPPTLNCGTSPSVDGNANMASGTVTVGSGTPATCTITFAAAYRVFNHCRVFSQAVNASLAYSYTLAAITVTGTGLTGKLDYDCDGN